MPPSEVHKKKRLKNIAVFAAVIAFMLVIYFVTVVRIQAGLSQ